ncbi:MAG: hypothetical protein Udaeo2_06460 [Candidatus Udaeobacter sp.]|nr:MAG: hypothetical protein Udaeo2_06460 [Candidatus Udaeobacter sp.]
MTATTSTNAMISVHFTSSAELTMVCDRSNTGVNLIEPGKLARSSGNSALTDLATSTALAPACRLTARTTTEPGGLKPRIQKKREMRSSCTLWRTSATSRR